MWLTDKSRSIKRKRWILCRKTQKQSNQTNTEKQMPARTTFASIKFYSESIFIQEIIKYSIVLQILVTDVTDVY